MTEVENQVLFEEGLAAREKSMEESVSHHIHR